MTSTLLFLLFLLMADVSVNAPVDNKYQNEIAPRPKADMDNIPKTAVLFDDIAEPNTLNRNADPCTAKGCKWPKSGCYVHVPYFISADYSEEERSIIIRGLRTFRLVPWKSGDRDYIYIDTKDG